MFLLRKSVLEQCTRLGLVAAVLCVNVSTASALDIEDCESIERKGKVDGGYEGTMPVTIAEVGLDTIHGVFGVGYSTGSTDSQQATVSISTANDFYGASWTTGKTEEITWEQEVDWSAITLLADDKARIEDLRGWPATATHYWPQGRRQTIWAYKAVLQMEEYEFACQYRDCEWWQGSSCGWETKTFHQIVPTGFTRDVPEPELITDYRAYDSCTDLAAGAVTKISTGRKIQETETLQISGQWVEFNVETSTEQSKSTDLQFQNIGDRTLHLCVENGTEGDTEGAYMLSDIDLSLKNPHPPHAEHGLWAPNGYDEVMTLDVIPDGTRVITARLGDFASWPSGHGTYYYEFESWCQEEDGEWHRLFSVFNPPWYEGNVSVDVSKLDCKHLWSSIDVSYQGDKSVLAYFDFH